MVWNGKQNVLAKEVYRANCFVFEVIRNSIESTGPIIGGNKKRFRQAAAYDMQTGPFIPGRLLQDARAHGISTHLLILLFQTNFLPAPSSLLRLPITAK